MSTSHPVDSPGDICGLDSESCVKCSLAANSTGIDELSSALGGVLKDAHCPLAPAIQRRLDFESLLAELSAKFVNLSASEVDLNIEAGLRRIVELLGIDRSCLCEVSADEKRLAITHSYQVPGVPTPVQLVLHSDLPTYTRMICEGKVVRSPEELPPEATQERDYCLLTGLKSNLTIPLTIMETVVGSIGFCSFRMPLAFSDELIPRLRLVGGIFTNALARKRTDDAFRAAVVENEKLRSRLEQENLYLREQVSLKHLSLKHQHKRIIGQSEALKRVLSAVEQVAVTDAPVLLLGETGTGKELLAETIHELSSRKKRPMVIVNCASLPATLIESELFGREAGAYTGAVSAQAGRFTVADGSTLFLDEIGEFPIELQSKLLRVLQDGRFERLGSSKTVTVNVRIIAATNRDLRQGVRDGKFRSDLYYRLNVFPIRVPPLRERPEDVPSLVWAFVETFSRRMGKIIKSIPRKTFEQLQRYSWPGNIRELSNVIERAMILASGDTLTVELPSAPENDDSPPTTLKESERAHILRVLHETNWRIRGVNGAAEVLGIKPTTLEARIAKLGIHRKKGISNIP